MPPKSTTIVVDDTNNVGEPDPVSANPSAHIIFVIRNDDAVPHLVRIPASSFQPDGTDPGPAVPMESSGKHSVIVDANDVDTIRYKVKSSGHFNAGRNSYKYTIFWADGDGSNEQSLDPDVEINN
jgi:hypothetical protein